MDENKVQNWGFCWKLPN